MTVLIILTTSSIGGHIFYQWIQDTPKKTMVLLGPTLVGKSAVARALLSYPSLRFDNCLRSGPLIDRQGRRSLPTTKSTCQQTYTLVGQQNYPLTIVDTPGFLANDSVQDDSSFNNILHYMDTTEEFTAIAFFVSEDPTIENYNFKWMSRFEKKIGTNFWDNVVLVRTSGVKNLDHFDENQKIWDANVRAKLQAHLGNKYATEKIPTVYLDPDYLKKGKKDTDIFLAEVHKLRTFLSASHFNIFIDKEKQTNHIYGKFQQQGKNYIYYAISAASATFILFLLTNITWKFKCQRNTTISSKVTSKGRNLDWRNASFYRGPHKIALVKDKDTVNMKAGDKDEETETECSINIPTETISEKEKDTNKTSEKNQDAGAKNKQGRSGDFERVDQTPEEQEEQSDNEMYEAYLP
jgi:hypothetical protein